MEDDKVTGAVRGWVESLVVGLNLCPFAKQVLIKNRMRLVVSSATDEEQLLTDLHVELDLLDSDQSIETSLLIHPKMLTDFYDYNQFLIFVDELLVQMRLDGIYQIASFHPDYQFGGTRPDDVENYSNRSPYPLLHLLREASLERAIAQYPDIDQIPLSNIELMKKLGAEKLQALLSACFMGAEGLDK